MVRLAWSRTWDDGTPVETGDVYASSNIWRTRARDPLDELVESFRQLPTHDRGRLWQGVRDALQAQVAYREEVPAPPAAPWDPPRLGQRRHEGPEQVVYYIRFADRVKIGTTRNIKKRLAVIPHDEVLGLEPGGYELERARHRQFAALRVTGEWFEYGDALREHVASL